MSNPLKQMTQPQQPMQNGGNPMFARIRQFAGLVGNRDPKQMALNLARQRGLTDEQMNELMQQAEEIKQQMGLG